jgi:hypothetical protein
VSLWSGSPRDCGIVYALRQIHRQASRPSRLGAFARTVGLATAALAVAAFLAAAQTTAVQPVHVLGIPVDFILFGLPLIGVALFHHENRVDLPAIHVTLGNAQ